MLIQVTLEAFNVPILQQLGTSSQQDSVTNCHKKRTP